MTLNSGIAKASFDHQLIHPSLQPSTLPPVGRTFHPTAHSPGCWPTLRLSYALSHSLTNSLTRPSTQPLTHPLKHSFLVSLSLSLPCGGIQFEWAQLCSAFVQQPIDRLHSPGTIHYTLLGSSDVHRKSKLVGKVTM